MRISALTGVRGVAAVAVMLYHIPEQKIFIPYGLKIVSRAYLCVDLFFILSGFVIALGYYDHVVNPPNCKAYGGFLINRMARIFPLHFIVTLVFSARLALNFSGGGFVHFTLIDFLANIFMIQSWGIGTIALAGNSWSVSAELAAYLLFPLLAWFAVSRNWWILLLLAVAGLLFVAVSGLGTEGVLDVVEPTSKLPLLRCVANFSLGLIAFYASCFSVTRRFFSRNIVFLLLCVTLIVVFLIPRGDLFVVSLFPFIVLCCYLEGSLVRAVVGNRLIYHLGLISYSIYLWHPLVRDVAARITITAHRHGVKSWDAFIVFGMIAVTWLLCWLSYEVIELRGHRFAKRIQRRFASRLAVDRAA